MKVDGTYKIDIGNYSELNRTEKMLVSENIHYKLKYYKARDLLMTVSIVDRDNGIGKELKDMIEEFLTKD